MKSKNEKFIQILNLEYKSRPNLKEFVVNSPFRLICITFSTNLLNFFENSLKNERRVFFDRDRANFYPQNDFFFEG